MNKLGRVFLLILILAFPLIGKCQDLSAPVVTLLGSSINIDGKFVHIHGKMPSEDKTWFYHIEKKSDHLYIYNFWTIEVFGDTKEDDYGLYEAKSWVLEVADSKDHPETAMIFDHLNDFLFWGNLTVEANEAKITICSIKGLPKSLYGPITLELLN